MIQVVRTGTANLASVLAAFRRLGAEPVITSDPHVVRSAEHVVLPGVGAFGAAMTELHQAGLVDSIRERLQSGRRTLTVCLGLQLLASHSDETPGVTGLSVFNTTVTRFPDTVRVPQLGWNEVSPDPGCRLLTPGHAYYANSYRLTDVPEGWHGAWSEHGGRFVGAIERGQVLACQFHPELSGAWGLDLLRRWLAC